MNVSTMDYEIERLKELGVGTREFSDPFFKATYDVCKICREQGVTSEDDESLCHRKLLELMCKACHSVSDNLFEYDQHQRTAHFLVCAHCRKIKPTSRLMEIHIEENHDSYFAVLSQKQSMHQCFVTECDIKFRNPEERREHCRTIHKFPKSYRYDDSEKVNLKESFDEEIKKLQADVRALVYQDETSTSATRRKDKRKKDSIAIVQTQEDITDTVQKSQDSIDMEVEGEDSDSSFEDWSEDEYETLPETINKFHERNGIYPYCNSNKSNQSSNKSSTLMFIPRQVREKVYAKALTQNLSMEKNVLETKSIMELGESLPN